MDEKILVTHPFRNSEPQWIDFLEIPEQIVIITRMGGNFDKTDIVSGKVRCWMHPFSIFDITNRQRSPLEWQAESCLSVICSATVSPPSWIGTSTVGAFLSSFQFMYLLLSQVTSTIWTDEVQAIFIFLKVINSMHVRYMLCLLVTKIKPKVFPNCLSHCYNCMSNASHTNKPRTKDTT